MSERPIHLALVGQKIQASQSPSVYQKLLGPVVNYSLCDYESAQTIPSLSELFAHYRLDGLSITSPYKRHFLSAVHVDPVVSQVNALNCIRQEGTEFFATNTDYLALCELYPQITAAFKRSKFMVYLLGNGVMASLFQVYLKARQQPYEQLARSSHNLDEHTNISSLSPLLIINCCARSFQFQGKIDAPNFLFWDLNYNATHAPELLQSSGYRDGSPFLWLQAKYAVSFWGL